MNVSTRNLGRSIRDSINGKLCPVMATDAEIIGAVLQGDIDRYGEVVDRYQLAAWKLAYSFVGNFEDAKELSQNGIVKAYRHLNGFRGKARFSTWLYRIIVNECKDFFKRKARQPLTVPLALEDPESNDPVLFDLADPTGDPRDVMENKELGKKISEAIKRLPMKQQTAFILCHLHGLPLEEAARVMGVRLGTVKAHLFRATESLRTSLEPLAAAEDWR